MVAKAWDRELNSRRRDAAGSGSSNYTESSSPGVRRSPRLAKKTAANRISTVSSSNKAGPAKKHSLSKSASIDPYDMILKLALLTGRVQTQETQGIDRGSSTAVGCNESRERIEHWLAEVA